MLPDFLNLKRVLAENEVAAIGRDVSNEPLLAEVGEFRQHEGDRLTLVRADGSIETLGFERSRQAQRYRPAVVTSKLVKLTELLE